MIEFDILARFSDEVNFTAEIDCAEDAPYSVKLGLAVKWGVEHDADLSNADLSNADLSNADLSNTNLWNTSLRSADLSNCNLSNASLRSADLSNASLWNTSLRSADLSNTSLWNTSLRSADLWNTNGLNKYVKCIQVETYAIAYTSEVMQIGCERHNISEWAGFDDKRILEMDGKAALKFWRKYKDWIFQTIGMCPAKPTGVIEPIEKG